MPIRFIHTADWQIGKPFAGIEDNPNPQKRVIVQNERIAVLERIARLVEEQNANFVLVAGDLFDSSRVTKATVSAACSAIGKIRVPVYAIPGNHDHGGPGSIWEQPFFKQEQQALAPNFQVFLQSTPAETPEAILLPCPLLRRHETADTTQWLRGFDYQSLGDKPRIVLAHGSVQGFVADSGEEDQEWTNRIGCEYLPVTEIDYLALGDWHGTKQITEKAWYSGTPEPDRFSKGNDHDPGNILVVEAGRNQMPLIQRVSTKRLGWHQKEFVFSGDQDLERFNQELLALFQERVEMDLLRLELSGSLGIEASAQLNEELERWKARLLRLKLLDHTRVAPTQAEVEQLTRLSGDPLIARVASRLLAQTQDPALGDDSEFASVALRELYTLCANPR